MPTTISRYTMALTRAPRCSVPGSAAMQRATLVDRAVMMRTRHGEARSTYLPARHSSLHSCRLPMATEGAGQETGGP
jgi:hypothetical protein